MKAVLVLAVAACGPHLVWHGHTPNRRHDVRVVEHHGQFVELDGVRGPTFDAIALGAFAISPDSAHIAYAARRSHHWSVVVDGIDGPAYDGIGEIIYSDDGAHLAFSAERGGAWRVVVDGREGPEVTSILAHTMQLTAGHVVYAATRGDGVHVVVDGVLGTAWSGVGRLTVSGDHVAYVARVGDIALVVADGRAGRGYDAITELAVAAGHVAYVAQRGNRWVAVVDDVESPAFELVRGLAFSADGAHVAFAARRAHDDTSVIVDGVPGASYRGVRPATIAFPQGSARPTYVARRGDRFFVVHDNVEGPPFDDIRSPVLGAEGRWGYVGRYGDAWIPVIDGVELRAFPWAGDPVFSEDGRRVAFLARRGSDVSAIVDETEHRFDIVLDGTLAFGPSGHWGCVAGDRKQRRFYFVIDGVRQARLEVEEAVDASRRTKPGDDRALHDWVLAEIGRSAR
ncbi:MAG: PD40 domain-containing protein [Deltaproteobacteria bacterium]|nr:PD40 domain-containing protein [Deltaproteobacteria bacterium]